MISKINGLKLIPEDDFKLFKEYSKEIPKFIDALKDFFELQIENRDDPDLVYLANRMMLHLLKEM